MNRQNVLVKVLVKMLKDIMMMTPNPKAAIAAVHFFGDIVLLLSEAIN